MMGYAELCMNEPNLTIEKIQDYLRIIFHNSQRANLLMTELFELSKIESPAYAINKSRIDLCEYLRERIAEYILLFEGHGFSYEFEIPEEEIFIEMDAAQFDRVLQNLVNNAIRYNPPGTKIAITLKDKGNEILIKFQDDGVGIPEKEAKEIFQPFVRVPVPEEDTVSAGTGLGLAIAEKIVIKHGGTIGLVTEANSGCEFLIRLPKF